MVTSRPIFGTAWPAHTNAATQDQPRLATEVAVLVARPEADTAAGTVGGARFMCWQGARGGPSAQVPHRSLRRGGAPGSSVRYVLRHVPQALRCAAIQGERLDAATQSFRAGDLRF